MDSNTWRPQAYQWLLRGNYAQAIDYYEQKIAANHQVRVDYWHLGLLLLLQEQETEAQSVWLFALTEVDQGESDQAINELLQVLHAEAERREALKESSIPWAIRQHIHEINPTDLNNSLHLVKLSSQLRNLTSEGLISLDLISLLQTSTGHIDYPLLLQVLQEVLKTLILDPIIVAFTEACLPHIHASSELMAIILPIAVELNYSMQRPMLAVLLLEVYQSLAPNDLEVLGRLALFYSNAREHEKAIVSAKRRLQLSDNYSEKIYSSNLLLRSLLNTGGRWQEAMEELLKHEQLLAILIHQSCTDLEQIRADLLFSTCYYLPYCQDRLAQHRAFQNRISQLCQAKIQLNCSVQVNYYQQSKFLKVQDISPTRRLKIGYLSHCMGSHSVGWLARWLIQHHDRDRVRLHGYFYNQRQGDNLQDWYISQFEQSYIMGVDGGRNSQELAEKIYQDEIDILVDLDSITLDLTAEVLALKPAPVQVTWLGWDASGLPAVDYFIADPYVLPDWAQAHYSEKIWRLPETYIAVDGFEVGVPTLRRDQLNVPTDAIVYLSAQRGYKRHRDTAKLQMQIIKAVPNSYLFIKGFADEDAIQKFFFEIAEAVGVATDRLRFLPDAPSEAVHRANLAIADIVLDTYPYNGATTTLETLWMGIPIVTRVGEQFAARNSYTMMLNAGLIEGIAWSDQEYVDWGIRLGTNLALRQQTSWKLKQSRHTAPLWNARLFTRNMECAYQQMWATYIENQLPLSP
jgi:predicted O-linked N-acetylglucosamine transferase (SPINDLY family)